MGRILMRPVTYRKLIKWMTELNKYNIQYHPLTVVKAQVLAEFLVKTSSLEEESLWHIFVDKSSIAEGSGVRVLLVFPQGDEVRLAVQLNIKAYNNEIEYEALIIKLKDAKNVRATWVVVHSDSQIMDGR